MGTLGGGKERTLHDLCRAVLPEVFLGPFNAENSLGSQTVPLMAALTIFLLGIWFR